MTSSGDSAAVRASALRAPRRVFSSRPDHVILLIGVLLLIAAPLVCGYFVISLYQSEVTAIRNRLEIPAHAMAHTMGAIARNADSALKNIQSSLDDAAQDRFAAEALHQILIYRNNISVAINRIAVYDQHGSPVLTSNRALSSAGSIAGYEFFRREAALTTDDMRISDLIPDPVDGTAEVVMSRRLTDKDGRFRGVAAVFVDATYLQQTFESLQMPAGASITAFNQDGHIIVRTPPIYLGDADLATDFTKSFRFRTFRDGPAEGSFARFRTITGADRFVAGLGGNQAPFVIAAGWDAEAALAAWRKESLAIGATTLGGLLVAFALLAYLRREIHRNDDLLARVSEAEARQRRLMTALPDAVAIIDDSLRIEFANPAAERIHGYEAGEMNGLPLSAIMADEARAEDEEAARRVVSSGDESIVRVLQRTTRRKDGSLLPVEISSCRFRSTDGWKLISVIRDVSVRDANDRALRRSRENLARAQRMAGLGSFDRDMRTGALEGSDEFLRMWGFDPDVVQATTDMLVERVHPQDREAFLATRVAVLSGKPPPVAEFRIIRPDGEERVFHQDYSADFGPDGRPMRLFGIVQDITERKAVEMELRRSREGLAQAQRIAALGSFHRDLVTGEGDWSEEFLRIWGLEKRPSGDTIRYLAEMVHPEDRERLVADREAAIRNEVPPPLDFRITRADGEVRVLHREYDVQLDENGRVIRLFGTLQDITERKAIEDELRRSREDLARAQRIAGIGSFSRDLSTGKTDWSDEFLRVWGLEDGLGELTAETLSVMVHPADRAAFIEGREKALTNGDGTALDFRIIRPDGQERILHREYGVLFDESGQAIRMFGTVQDITERRQVELELRRSRENMARAQRLACIGSFERDLATGTSEWSDEMYRIMGAEIGKRPSDEELMNLVHPDDRERFQKVRADQIAGVPTQPIEYRIIRRDGAERIVRRESAVSFDAEKRPIRLFGTVQDITERKQAEIEIIQSRESMIRAQQIANMGSFDHDLATGRITWSDQIYSILGIENGSVTPSSDVTLQYVHPDDREGFIATRLRSTEPHVPAIEFRIIRPDGQQRLLRREYDVHFGPDGRPQRVFGTMQDITERRAAELEIEQSREGLMRAQRIANLGSFDHDLVTNEVTWSDQMYRILGVEKDEIVPSVDATLSFVHPDDRAAFLAARLVGNQVSSVVEFRIIRPDGEERVIRREIDVHFAEDGRALRIFGTLQDITQRVVADARERELERQLLHSQKLEALGTLAGGIAHDLNNTLVPIMALSKLTARRFEPGTPVRNNLDTIYEASERARDLVRRVLAFSRKEEPEQQEANLSDVVREALKLMRATVPTSIQLDAEIAEVPVIRADASQIHQVITNLISNAAGAMTNGMGTITVSLGLNGPKNAPDGLRLSVKDTGCGMDEATMQRIFEPFFTTKAVGQGTGLGLSIVHGIVTSHGGRIEVKSAIGKGTCFDLYFPLPGAEKKPAEKGNAPVRSSRPAA